MGVVDAVRDLDEYKEKEKKRNKDDKKRRVKVYFDNGVWSRLFRVGSSFNVNVANHSKKLKVSNSRFTQSQKDMPTKQFS